MKKKWAVIGGSIAGVIVVIGLAFLIMWPVKPLYESMTLELGEEVSVLPEDYVSGVTWSVNLTEIDVSGVDEDLPGEYEAYALHGSKTYTYTILIEDTKAPEIMPKDAMIYLASGREYTAEDLIQSVEDAAKEISLQVKTDKGLSDTFTYDEIGDYSLSVVATDPSQNETKLDVEFIIDTAPVLDGVQNCYVTPGSEQDLMERVTATDDVDGEMTGQVELDESGVDWETEGAYEISYAVTDQYGLETIETTTVNVVPQDELESMIATRQINWRTELISGAVNKYDAGVGTLDTVEEQAEYMLPAIVHLFIPINSGNILSAFGSGYITYIDEEYVYICSNEHVMKYKDTGTTYFYDGTTAEYEVLYKDAEKDAAVARIKRADIEEETMDNLIYVHVDETAVATAEQGGTDIFMVLVGEKGYQTTRTGETIGMTSEFQLSPVPSLKNTLRLVHGNSGSALFDMSGNLIGMGMGTGTGPGYGGTWYYAVPVSDVIEVYETGTEMELPTVW